MYQNHVSLNDKLKRYWKNQKMKKLKKDERGRKEKINQITIFMD